jgi:ribonuclease R
MDIPTRDSVLGFLSDSPTPLTKRELIQAFGLKGEEQRVILKRLLRDMEADGAIVKQPGQAYAIPDALPEIGIIEVIDVDIDGDVFAAFVDWDAEKDGPPPVIEVTPGGRGHPALAVGQRALARLSRIEKTLYQASVVRPLDAESGRVLGLVAQTRHGYILQPTNRKNKFEFDIPTADMNGAIPGNLVVGEIQPDRGATRKKVRIREVIGDQTDPKAISLIALHEVGLRIEFPAEVIKQTEGMVVPPLGNREDFRKLPLVTIDGADARDFDDAVFAERDGDGFHLIVAIADVSFYVRPGTALDNEGYRRGNSTYFPDRVVPMLPEALSNDLCSLRPHEDRACLAAHLWINGGGTLVRYKFARGLMHSKARLTYEQVQAAKDGIIDDVTRPLMDGVINPLYDAFVVLKQARERRGALELDLPERKIILNDAGEMVGIKPRARLESHKLIEEFMILANVAAAQALESQNAPCIYRVHDRPSMERLDNVREFVESFGLSMPKGQVTRSSEINNVLLKASEMPYGHLIHEMLLRSQMQAVYSPENLGHFGLALQRYAHFTSPIRRYADLVIHRSLVKAFDMGAGGLSDEEAVRMEEVADHISQTERLSAEAERSTIDRFAAAYLSHHIGATFAGRITGVTRFGLFVKLDESGADGLVPIRSLPQDYYIHDEKQHALIGRRNNLVYRLGANVTVALLESDPMTGSTILEIIGEGADIPGMVLKRPVESFRSGPPRRNGGNYRDKNKGKPRSDRAAGDKPQDRSFKPKSDRPGGASKGKKGPPKGRNR